jgi:hypothetical protein
MWSFDSLRLLVLSTVTLSLKHTNTNTNKKKQFYFYRCTVHFEDSLIITYQQMH